MNNPIQWYLWACSACSSTMKINHVASEQDYERFKACHCGGTLEYKEDLEGDGE
ncbi:hypothetical protein L1N85_11275 [Paenibacillus alkaliterrae]|uniref:hypothetical protein n=1 Tax=Paenibacillus alkaliterrae TaxID=320909 RepID=UPI001F435F33|nr:hypothetical protein [Paenibacillus alkaliterrae]MCF2939018.1 hypothetical protein [Paenibacillus alkaliterrae]